VTVEKTRDAGRRTRTGAKIHQMVRGDDGMLESWRYAASRMRRGAASIGRRLQAGVADGEDGATATEYALLLALIVVTLIGTLSALGGALDAKLRDIIEQITNAG